MTESVRDPRELADALELTAEHRPAAGRAAEVGADIKMRIARDGTWFYHGSPIARKPLVRLFASVLRREDDGLYSLVTPAERCRVEVEDAPFLAVEVTRTGTGRRQRLAFRTNIDDMVTASAHHPIRVVHDEATGEPSPYLLVRERLEALIARSAYYELVDYGVAENIDDVSVFGVWSEGSFFELGRLAVEGGG